MAWSGPKPPLASGLWGLSMVQVFPMQARPQWPRAQKPWFRCAYLFYAHLSVSQIKLYLNSFIIEMKIGLSQTFVWKYVRESFQKVQWIIVTSHHLHHCVRSLVNTSSSFKHACRLLLCDRVKGTDGATERIRRELKGMSLLSVFMFFTERMTFLFLQTVLVFSLSHHKTQMSISSFNLSLKTPESGLVLLICHIIGAEPKHLLCFLGKGCSCRPKSLAQVESVAIDN